MQDEVAQEMPQDHGDAGDATLFGLASSATPSPPPVNSQRPDTTDSGDAGDANVIALSDDVEYTITVGQAQERFSAAGRKVPSERSMQRHCEARLLVSKKIRTSTGQEWLINETSLARFIESEPVVTGDAGVASTPDMLTPATPIVQEPTVDKAATDDNGDAGVAGRESMAKPVGERRTIAEVLIENARLFAQLDGAYAIIEVLKEHESFLREEVREGRRSRDDVKGIAERMLDTLKTMATGRLSMPDPSPQEPIRATIVDTENRQG